MKNTRKQSIKEEIIREKSSRKKTATRVTWNWLLGASYLFLQESQVVYPFRGLGLWGGDHASGSATYTLFFYTTTKLIVHCHPMLQQLEQHTLNLENNNYQNQPAIVHPMTNLCPEQSNMYSINTCLKIDKLSCQYSAGTCGFKYIKTQPCIL